LRDALTVTPEALEQMVLALAGAELSIKWGEDRCDTVGGKMFAATNGSATTLSLKVSDIAFEVLTETHRAKPAPYAARFKWVMFDDLSVLESRDVNDWLKTAHELVAAKRPRKQRLALGITG
jgi:predicted DNA-binding protein (MmcQ/YjbR family)